VKQGPALRLALAMTLLPLPALAAEPLTLVSGKPMELACTTRAVVLAPAEATTSGTIRLKLEAAAAGEEAGRWSVLEVDGSHKGSFAGREQVRCANGCPIKSGKRLELWAPRIADPKDLRADDALLVAAIDPATLKLNATTVIDNAVVALEQGDCRPQP
jgi:putative ubiquitin-RnfH superfamily antitoxin RatB of RatAB toxin-antitoxin module